MAEEQNVQELLNSAITAHREGDKSRAQTLFEQIVEIDPQNEKGWYWLASLVETDEERRVCLGNVVYINPNNERAQQLLDRLEGKADVQKSQSDEIAPGISRRALIYGGGGIAILVVIVVGLILVLITGQNRANTQSEATLQVLNANTTATVQQQLADQEATQVAVLAASATATTTATDLPPLFTATPTPEPTATTIPMLQAIGSGLFSGSVLSASGDDITNRGRVDIVAIPLDGGPPQTIFDGINGATSPALSPDGRFAVYTRFSGGGDRDKTIELAWLDGTQPPRVLSQVWGGRILTHQDDASFSPDGNSVAFSGRELGSDINTLYILSLLATGVLSGEDVPDEVRDQALQQITDGVVDSYNPTWADSTHLVYVANNNGVIDLTTISTGGVINPVTSDGGAVIESYPDLSPDGTTVIYAAATHSSPDDVDIWSIPLGGGQPTIIVDSPFTDTRPRWDPDGRNIMFSSNRSGNWEIYIIDPTTYLEYQMTNSEDYDQGNYWAR